MLEYYTTKEVLKILPVSQTTARELIKKLRNKFEEKYPDDFEKMTWIFGKKTVVIPVWYFNEEIIISNRKKE